jgi:GT2 family glycosyltransferase
MSSPTNTSITLSVVIVSYNVRNYVLEAIESLYQFLPFPIQIILADNNSSDHTVETVKEKFPKVSIIANTQNVGFSAANNQCFDLCVGKYVLMFNPDALLIDDSINKMIAAIESKCDHDILIAPKLINTNNSIQTSCWKFPSPFQHLLELFFVNTLIDTTSYSTKYLEKECEVDFLSGACILMSQTTLKKLKGLDVNLFWMDDVDFGKRNLLQGGLNLYYPLSVVKHHIGQSSKKNQNIVISNQIISKLKFYKKHKQYFYFLISVPIFFFQIISRTILFLILGIFKESYRTKFKAYVFTFFKFFNYLFFGSQAVI